MTSIPRGSFKTLLLIPVLCGSLAADEASDRAAITLTIRALNQVPQPADLFTQDSDAHARLESLSKGGPTTTTWQIQPGPVDSLPGRPAVTISHEPMGEATLTFPGIAPIRALEILNPRIEVTTIHFVADDVALADATWTNRDGADASIVPLLFAMKRDGASWKIATVRVLAPAPKQ